MEKIKTADKASISNAEAKSTEIDLKETESSKALPAVGIVIDHSVVIFKSRTMFTKNKKKHGDKIIFLHDKNGGLLNDIWTPN